MKLFFLLIIVLVSCSTLYAELIVPSVWPQVKDKPSLSFFSALSLDTASFPASTSVPLCCFLSLGMRPCPQR